MAYVTPGTVAAGDVATAAAWNVLTNDVISFRNKSGIVPPMCRLEKSAGASITSGAAITWNVESFDTDSMHSTVTNTERITIVTAGVYLVTFTYLFNYSGTLTKEQPQVRKNSAGYQYGIKYGSGATNTANTLQFVASLSQNDYLDALVDFTGATSITVDGNTTSTSFSAVMLGATS